MNKLHLVYNYYKDCFIQVYLQNMNSRQNRPYYYALLGSNYIIRVCGLFCYNFP